MNELQTRDRHVFVPIEELTASAAEILSVSPELVEKGIEDNRAQPGTYNQIVYGH